MIAISTLSNAIVVLHHVFAFGVATLSLSIPITPHDHKPTFAKNRPPKAFNAMKKYHSYRFVHYACTPPNMGGYNGLPQFEVHNQAVASGPKLTILDHMGNVCTRSHYGVAAPISHRG